MPNKTLEDALQSLPKEQFEALPRADLRQKIRRALAEGREDRKKAEAGLRPPVIASPLQAPRRTHENMESSQLEETPFLKKVEAARAYANASIDAEAFERMVKRWTVISGAVGTLLTWMQDPTSMHWVLIGVTTSWAGTLLPMLAGSIYSRRALRELRKKYG